MRRCDPESDQRTIVCSVQGIPGQPESRDEPVHHFGQMLDGAGKLCDGGRIALPETRRVGRNRMVPIRQQWDQVRDICDELGKPCNSTITGAAMRPASR